MTRTFFSTIVILVFLWMVSTDCMAGGFANNDVGATMVAMHAVVGKGDANDVANIWHNPAALTEMKGKHLTLSTLAGIVQVGLQLYDQSEQKWSEITRPDIAWGALPFFGYVDDFGAENWKFGFAWFFPNLLGATVPDDAPTKYHIVRGFFMTSNLTATAARKLSERLSFGIGLAAMYAHLYGQRRFSAAIDDQGNRIEFPNSMITLSNGDLSWNWHSSFLFKATDRLNIGLTYTGRQVVQMDGTLKIEDVLPFLDGKYDTESEMLVPRSLRLGFNYKISPKYNIGFDVAWFNYGELKDAYMYVTDDDWPDEQLEGMFGDNMRDLTAPRDYTDSYNLGLGVEWIYSPKWKFRFGSQYDWSPIPDKTFVVDTPNSDLFALCAGFSYRKSERTEFEFSYEHLWFKERNIKYSITDPPTTGRSISTNNDAISFGVHYSW